MATQTLRTKEGLAVAYLGSVAVNSIMSEMEGHVTIKKFEGGRSSRVFIIDGNFTYGPKGLKLTIWEGFHIELEVLA